MTNLLVELQTEELPPKALKKLSEAFANGIKNRLAESHFLGAKATARTFATPRRLGVLMTDVLKASPDETFRQKLVPVHVGLDAEGNATPALTKKLAALGLAAEVADLKRENDGKNEQLVYEGVRRGRPLIEGLQEALDFASSHLPIPKVMHYQLADGKTTVEFVRPAKHLVALYGDEVVNVRLLGLEADRVTSGHRFHCPNPVVIPSADDYEAVMKSSAHVVPSFEERHAQILGMIEHKAAEIGAKAIVPEELLDEVTALTEWPVIYESGFEESFLAVPQECLILTMQENQRYFALTDEAGKLINRFLLVSQLVAKDGGKAIAEGNARVVRARLADAKFFYDQDRLVTLESRVPQLKQVVYHNRLGTQAERVERVKAIARAVAERIGADADKAVRAATLAKADLLTLMVGEFPELQGIMGEYYAKHDGEDDEVALAIREHYQPRFAGDALPSTLVSVAVALADKLETLSGLFGIGQMPTGDKDPFALRRHALGVLRMLLEKKLKVSVSELTDIGYEALKSVEGVSDARAQLREFFADRVRVMFRDMGYTAQEIDAVMAVNPETVLEIPARLEAVRAFMKLPEAPSLVQANKRIGNILKKATDVKAKVEPELFSEDAEKVLYEAIEGVREKFDAQYSKARYKAVLQLLAPMKPVVDDFFERVLVNAEEPAIRDNRIALLASLHTLMNAVAELARLA
ncbi:MAG TPA: glycine--tRNA ligase subunit beta [Sutterella sp.]|nr:glycine--tRNA ligase subunit beta [Sutterella sp.]